MCYCPCMNSRAYCPLMAGAVSLSDSCPLWLTEDSSQSTDRLTSFPRFPLIYLIGQNRTFVSCCKPHLHINTQVLMHTHTYTYIPSPLSRAIPLRLHIFLFFVPRLRVPTVTAPAVFIDVCVCVCKCVCHPRVKCVVLARLMPI